LGEKLTEDKPPWIQWIRISRGQGKPSGRKTARSRTEAKELSSHEGDKNSDISDDHMSIFMIACQFFFRQQWASLQQGQPSPREEDAVAVL
jgi:hypothetical protein